MQHLSGVPALQQDAVYTWGFEKVAPHSGDARKQNSIKTAHPTFSKAHRQ
jgi:hypothetical protein